HGKRRRVGCEHGAGLHHGLELGKQRFLDVQALDHGLDHQIAISQFLHAAGDLQPLFAGLHRCGVHPALLDQACPLGEQLVAGFGNRLRPGVVELDDAARLGGDLGDAPSHGAGTDDAHDFVDDSHAGDYGNVPSPVAGACREREANALTAIASSRPAKPAQCSRSMPPPAISQPPPAAPIAWPAYMAEVFRAIDPEARVGSMPTRRACCAEFEAKQPKAQGIDTSAASASVVPSGQINRLTAMAAMPAMTARDAPMRSMWRDMTMLPRKPKMPNHISSRLSWPGVMPIFCL